MTTKEFCEQLLSKHADWGLSRTKLQEIVTTSLDLIDKCTVEHKEVYLGKHYFKLRTRKARNIRNPHTHEIQLSPERQFVYYKKRVH